MVTQTASEEERRMAIIERCLKRARYEANLDTHKGEVSANVTLVKASDMVEKKINEVVKLKQEWDVLFHGEFQRTRPGSKRAKKVEGEMKHIESRVEGTAAEIREISKDIQECADALSAFGASGIRRNFEMWKPEEEFAVRTCKELLLKYTVR